MTDVFSAAETHGVALRPKNRLVAHSEGLGWRSVYADVVEEVPYKATMSPADEPGFAYIRRGSARIQSVVGDCRFDVTAGPRQLLIVPPGATSTWHLAGKLEFGHIYLRRAVLDSYVERTYGTDPAKVVLLPRCGGADPLLEPLALGVMCAMQERPPGHALYVDCLAQAVSAHLVLRHSTLARPPRVPKPDGLTDYRLRRLADHIEAHLADDLSLNDLAVTVGLSPVYLVRTFKRAFGETPHRYVLERRVERAKEMLSMRDVPIAEVALACGFASQSHLSTWFKRLVGATPGRYRSERLS